MSLFCCAVPTPCSQTLVVREPTSISAIAHHWGLASVVRGGRPEGPLREKAGQAEATNTWIIECFRGWHRGGHNFIIIFAALRALWEVQRKEPFLP